MALQRSHVSLEQRILAPAVKGAEGALCMTCGRLVDSENLVEGEPGKTTFAKVLAKHHGAEELRTFDMGSIEWDSYELRSHMMRANWFDPRGDAGLGVKLIARSDDEDAPIKAYVPSGLVGPDGRPL